MFENSVILDLVFRRPGIRRKADLEAVETEADKTMLSLSKLIIDSDEYRAIGNVAIQCRKDIARLLYGKGGVKSMPRIFKKGAYLVPIPVLSRAIEIIKEARAEYQVAIMALLAVYPQRVAEARERLGSQFREEDYPSDAKLVKMFDVQYQVIKLDIPDKDLVGEDIAREETERRKNIWNDMLTEVSAALRESFQQLLDHLIEKLKPSDNGAKKVLRESAVENLWEFVENFSTRNLANDAAMELLVNEARKILQGVDVDGLRKDAPLRAAVASKMAEVKEALDAVMEDAPRRRFVFEED